MLNSAGFNMHGQEKKRDINLQSTEQSLLILHRISTSLNSGLCD